MFCHRESNPCILSLLLSEYREPYLIIVQFNSLEVLLIDVESSSSAETSKLDRAFLSFPRSVPAPSVDSAKPKASNV